MRKRTILLSALVAALFAAVAFVQSRQRAAAARRAAEEAATPAPGPESPVGKPAVPGGPVIAEAPRIAALDPGIAEALCMLGLGGHLVARSAFTDFPASVTNLPVVLGADGLDLEALAAAKPDFTVLPQPMLDAKLHRALEERHMGHFAVDNTTLSGFYQSVYELADRFQAEDAANAWLETMDEITGEAAARVAAAVTRAGGRAPAVLLVLGRPAGAPDRVLAAGRRSLHQSVLEALSLPNACAEEVPYAEMSAAEAAALRPDVVLEIRVAGDGGAAVVDALTDWAARPEAPAVRTRDVHVLTERWALRAGPRIDLLLSALADYAAQWAEKQ